MDASPVEGGVGGGGVGGSILFISLPVRIILLELLALVYTFLSSNRAAAKSLRSVFIAQARALAVIAQHGGSGFTVRRSWQLGRSVFLFTSYT